MVRLVASIVLCLAAVVAIVSYFVHKPGEQLGGIFTICCLLYLIAAFSIVRHLIGRRALDTENAARAIAAHLLIGMSFAFAYKVAGEFGSVPFFGSAGPARSARAWSAAPSRRSASGYVDRLHHVE